MIRFLVRTAIFLVSAAVGLLVAAGLIDGVDVTTSGFLTAVVLFAVIQSILAPMFESLLRSARALGHPTPASLLMSEPTRTWA